MPSSRFNKKKYVSRGGTKLEAALKHWNVPVKGKIVLDAGCSTGGFTDHLLRSGAAAVHAVDVGYNQLDYSLRVHPSVIVHEKTNIMAVQKLDPVPDFAVADLSFRSMRGAASHILALVKEGPLIALIKPQFEYEGKERKQDDFNGVVKDGEQLYGILIKLIDELRGEQAFVTDIVASPITGRKGNREFFFLMENNPKRSASQVGLEARIRSIIGR